MHSDYNVKQITPNLSPNLTSVVSSSSNNNNNNGKRKTRSNSGDNGGGSKTFDKVSKLMSQHRNY